MEVIKIGTETIKISLNPSEVKSYRLSEEYELGIEELKNTFAKILLRVNKEIGFDYRGHKIIAEIFSSKDGGSEIFVSYAREEDMYKEKTSLNEMRKAKPQRAIYSFDKIEKLLSAMSRLYGIGYDGESTAYYNEEQKKYYILLEDISIKELKYAFLCEYSRQLKNNTLGHIIEHSKCIAQKNAVEKLSQLI